MKLRNIAIIAHVDHGKTTLVDRLLQQSGAFRENQRVAERVMDSNDLERERGITILAKATSVVWKDARVNIVDTPGHADFGGEVERILSMVDGAIVLVDAAEGPMPQTKFVVGKALKIGLKPIVCVNKVDKSDARPSEVVNECFDLFAALDATDEQLDFPIIYGSAKQGWMANSPDGPKENMAPLFDLVLKHVEPPKVGAGSFRMLGTLLEANPYLGRIITGRIFSGSIKTNAPVKVLDRLGHLVETGRVSKILAFRGIEHSPIDEASAGDIVAIAGLEKFNVADTLCSPEEVEPLHRPADRPADPVDDLLGQRQPARRHRGRQGDEPRHPRPPVQGGRGQRRAARRAGAQHRFLRRLRARRIAARDPDRDDAARGLRTRRVAAQGAASRATRRPARLLEPIEEVVIDVDEEHSGVVVQKMSERKGEMIEMRPSGGDRLRLVFLAPTRGLIGYLGELLTDTRGTAIMNRLFHNWGAWRGDIAGRRNGVLISNDEGEAVAYAMWNLEDRGPMMIEPGWKVYQGMIVGQHTRDNDLEVNVLKGKKLTNIRTHSKDEAVRLTPPIQMTLEKAIAYIQDDELVEVTPKSIRLRKALLDPLDRKRAERAKGAAAAEGAA